ncbi:MAG: hypothetical protein M3N10_02610 [Actinomycetota bacterium]|nr:hypothetical protein [Actinomycetota bacterium]
MKAAVFAELNHQGRAVESHEGGRGVNAEQQGGYVAVAEEYLGVRPDRTIV